MSDILNKVETTEARPVEFLTNFDVEFVSLVDKASMRTPFKIIRGDGEVKRMLNVVQSVLVPSTLDMAVLRAEHPWLAGLNLELVDEFEHYKKYNQIDAAKFNEGSLRIERLDGGALALVGDLDEEIPSALIMRSSSITAVEPASFKQLVLYEVDSMLSTVLGALEMREMSVKDKKRTVSSALDAFRAYVGISLDHLGENIEVRFDDYEPRLSKKQGDMVMMGAVEEVRQETVPETVPETQNKAEALFNISEETIGKMLEERVQKVIMGLEEKVDGLLAKMSDTALEAKPEERAEDVSEPVVDPTIELRAQIKSLEERLAKFEAEDSELHGRSSDVDAREEINRVSKEAEPKNIWSGLFFKN